MKLPRRQFLHLAAGAAALPTASRFAWAQAYPARPVRIIVPSAPAGPTDILARLMGQWLSERLGQQFVIENRPGGGGNIGTEAVVRASPDGYTLLMVGSLNTIHATLYDKLNYNFIRDIAPVASVVRYPSALTSRPRTAARSSRSASRHSCSERLVKSNSQRRWSRSLTSASNCWRATPFDSAMSEKSLSAATSSHSD
jgi:tripartite-type tricarboxylate transporter receptor subunit TctC